VRLGELGEGRFQGPTNGGGDEVVRDGTADCCATSDLWSSSDTSMRSPAVFAVLETLPRDGLNIRLPALKYRSATY